MNLIAELHAMVDDLAEFVELDVPARELGAGARRLDDEQAVAAISRATRLINGAERLRVVLAGVAAERSTRDRGHKGVAQTRGHRTPESLIQSITGVTRAEAAKQVRLGEAMLDDGMPTFDTTRDGEIDVTGIERAGAESAAVESPWHDPLRTALLEGRLASAHHDAILRGLGEPPLPADTDPDDEGGAGTVTIDGIVRAIGEVREVWRIAAEQLLLAAPDYTPEDLLREARRTRDLIHPEGAQERFTKRYEARSYRRWTNRDGQRGATILFDVSRYAASPLLDNQLGRRMAEFHVRRRDAAPPRRPPIHDRRGTRRREDSRR